jgi:hypothetical protein
MPCSRASQLRSLRRNRQLLGKQRHAPPGAAAMQYKPDVTRFADLADDHMPARIEADSALARRDGVSHPLVGTPDVVLLPVLAADSVRRRVEVIAT